MSQTVTLTIDGKQAEIPAGSTILQAADALCIRIPTLCYLKGKAPLSSCFVCVVQVEGRAALSPACSTLVENGMVVTSESDDVREARRTAFELLLSEHHGDCEGPCRIACPADLDIPAMIEHVTDGDLPGALRAARESILFNSVLGRICPAFCERVCRRGQLDAPVAIAALQRHVGDAAAMVNQPPERRAASTGKKVAIFGAGPAGLTAAYYLLRLGHACTVFDAREAPGGRLREIDDSRLPKDVLETEIEAVRRLGAHFRMGTTLDAGLWTTCRPDFDAMLLATGAALRRDDEPLEARAGRAVDVALAQALGFDTAKKGIAADAKTGKTNLAGVFAAGECVSGADYCVRAVKAGRVSATALDQFLSGREVTGEAHTLNVRMGRLAEDELAIVRATATDAPRMDVPPADETISDEAALAESKRCVRCACLAKDHCALRTLAHEYGARPGHYQGPHRPYRIDLSHPDVVYESNKCILCGLCIREAREMGEMLGLSFLGRGFAATMGVPFEHSVIEGLRAAAAKCVAVCPTGALSWKHGHAPPDAEG